MKRITHLLVVSLLLVSFFVLNGLPQMAQAAKMDSLPATNPSSELHSGGPFTNFPLYAANFNNNNVVRLDSSANQSLVTSDGNISNSFGLAIDSSGNLYIGDIGYKIIKISPGGAQSVFIADTGGIPYGLACDDNDNLYFTKGSEIIKVTPAGVQSVFSSYGYLGNLAGLAIDSRGNLYAANYQTSTNSVVKITPAGVQSVFTQGGEISDTWGLAFDANDNLYVTDANRIIKVTQAGVQSVYASGGSLNYPEGLAVDSDGNLYAGNYTGQDIVKIDTGGVQSVFASGGYLYSPIGLAFGGGPTQVTTTTVELAPNPAVFGQSVSFTATVTGTTGTPTGIVDFFDDSTSLSGCGHMSLDESGAATCTTATLAAGTHPISASYNGYGDYITSTSTITDLVVLKAPTKTRLTASAPNPSIYGNSVTFTASVTSTTGVTPVGSITLTIDTTDIVRTLDANGVATYVTNTLAADTHAITATYGGGANFLSNPSTTITVSVINPAPVLTQLLPASATVGASGVTLDIHGSGFIPDSQVYWNGAAITTTLVSPTALQAEISASRLATTGVYSVTVENPLPGGGTSNSLLFTVNKAASSVGLASSANPARFGDTILITATVSGGTVGTPSGTVTISTTVRGKVLQMKATSGQTLVDGKAVFTLPALAPGSYDIQVIYSGDDRFFQASGSLTQVVSAPKVYLPLLLQNAE